MKTLSQRSSGAIRVTTFSFFPFLGPRPLPQRTLHSVRRGFQVTLDAPAADEADPVSLAPCADKVERTPTTAFAVSSPSRILRDFRGGPRRFFPPSLTGLKRGG